MLPDWRFKVYHGDIEITPWLPYGEAEQFITANKNHYQFDLYTYAKRSTAPWPNNGGNYKV